MKYGRKIMRIIVNAKATLSPHSMDAFRLRNICASLTFNYRTSRSLSQISQKFQEKIAIQDKIIDIWKGFLNSE